MSDLFGNHIVGFPTRWLNFVRFKFEFLFTKDNYHVHTQILFKAEIAANPIPFLSSL